MKNRKNKRNFILNIIIIILVIAIICVIIPLLSKQKVKTKEMNEGEYRNAVKDNVIYEYITKPQEEQNAIKEQEEKKREELMQNEETKRREERENEIAANLEKDFKDSVEVSD